ncbi:hypothetical protein GCM10011371_13470 [Novosphingobium marinum]|uniref:Uncharacterized protein n=1 Tax=Novosphingobium marinum TaxID=1514948 RepID=A0A7Y9XVW6_9SPHN|nr:hypothetical protein [Novosphingobium marinum]NYH95455.1 hypothetical protein [Novosphingobium marinum]GGC27203.1 hypothetical protein GCM10011371_13470 [Novosphingobium marinum]
MQLRKTTLAGRSNLDWAIVASILAMVALNLVVLSDHLGPAKAFAATPTCQIELA